jgi:hypothetical protein
VPVSSLQKWDRNTAPPLGTRLSSIPSPASGLFLSRCPPVFPGGGSASQPDPTANQNSISTNDKVVRSTATEPEDMTHTVPTRRPSRGNRKPEHHVWKQKTSKPTGSSHGSSHGSNPEPSDIPRAACGGIGHVMGPHPCKGCIAPNLHLCSAR